MGSCPTGDGDDTIVLTGDVSLTDQLPDIRTNLTIEGNGFTVSRDPLATEDFPVFSSTPVSIQVEMTAEYRNLHITGGNGARAGGISQNFRSDMVLVDSTVSGNEGNGIYTAGETTIVRSTISGNSTNGIESSYAQVDVFASTISGNAEIGILVGEYTNVALVNSTVSGNDIGIGDVFANYPYVSLVHTTIARNRIGFDVFPLYDGAVTMQGSIFGKNRVENCAARYFVALDGNLADDRTCGLGFRRLTGLSGNLADWGGPTLTHGLKSHSSAIDAAGTCGLATDQRGFLRDPDACDSGAHERGAQPLVPASRE